MKRKKFLNIALASSLLITSLFGIEEVRTKIPLSAEYVAVENNGNIPAIDAYQDGVGIFIADESSSKIYDNTDMNLLVFKYGELSKNTNSYIYDYVYENGTNEDKEKINGIARFEPLTPADGTSCDDLNDLTSFDVYKNGQCVGEAVSKKNCNEILKAGLSTGDGIYLVDKNGAPDNIYCDMTTNGGGWSLVALIPGTYSYGINSTEYNQFLLMYDTDNTKNEKNLYANYSNININYLEPREVMIKKSNGSVMQSVNTTGAVIPDFYSYFLNANRTSSNLSTINAWLASNMKINGGTAQVWTGNSNAHLGWSSNSTNHMLMGIYNSTAYKGICLQQSCWSNQGGAIYVR